jgi:antitoxin PrlF
MSIVTVSEKGQVVIPAAIRRDLGIKPGMELDFEVEAGSIRVNVRHGVPPSSIESGFGMLKAKPSRKPRHLLDFDVADAMRREARR